MSKFQKSIFKMIIKQSEKHQETIQVMNETEVNKLSQNTIKSHLLLVMKVLVIPLHHSYRISIV